MNVDQLRGVLAHREDRLFTKVPRRRMNSPQFASSILQSPAGIWTESGRLPRPATKGR